MSEMIFRIPSKRIQYGYVEITIPPEDLPMWDGSPESLGDFYYNYVTRFQQGEKEAYDEINRKPDPDLMPTVIASEAANKAAERAKDEVLRQQTEELTENDLYVALGSGHHDVEDAAEELIKSQLGATVVSGAAPWTEPPTAPEEEKPWQKKKSSVPDLL